MTGRPDLRLGDAFELARALPVASVDAIVTSPPYGDHRDVGGCHPDEYAAWISPLLAELRMVLRPHGGFMLNLGRIFRDGEEHPYVTDTLAAARLLGWRHVDTIIWHKLNAHPFQAPQYLHNKHEIVYWLANDVDCYRGYTAETRRPAAPETVARRKRAGLRGPKNRSRGDYKPAARTVKGNPNGIKPASVFGCNIGREKGIDHDSPMALELARHLVALACPPGALVLDPFVGSGTTAVACHATGRDCIGFDVDPAALTEARRRVASVQTELEGVA